MPFIKQMDAITVQRLEAATSEFLFTSSLDERETQKREGGLSKVMAAGMAQGLEAVTSDSVFTSSLDDPKLRSETAGAVNLVMKEILLLKVFVKSFWTRDKPNN